MAIRVNSVNKRKAHAVFWPVAYLLLQKIKIINKVKYDEIEIIFE